MLLKVLFDGIQVGLDAQLRVLFFQLDHFALPGSNQIRTALFEL